MDYKAIYLENNNMDYILIKLEKLGALEAHRTG